jgi:hypothetical protein
VVLSSQKRRLGQYGAPHALYVSGKQAESITTGETILFWLMQIIASIGDFLALD